MLFVNMDNTKLQQLERRVAELEKYVSEKKKQQISFPLDQNSIGILRENFMQITGRYDIYYGGAGGNSFPNYVGNQGSYNFEVGSPSMSGYSVDISANTVTAFGTNLKYFDGFLVQVATTDTPPAPLVAGDIYNVINSDGFTFQLEASVGGGAINITTAGTGLQFIQYAL